MLSYLAVLTTVCCFLFVGAAVYDSELLLNGIVIQKLEFERLVQQLEKRCMFFYVHNCKIHSTRTSNFSQMSGNKDVFNLDSEYKFYLLSYYLRLACVWTIWLTILTQANCQDVRKAFLKWYPSFVWIILASYFHVQMLFRFEYQTYFFLLSFMIFLFFVCNGRHQLFTNCVEANCSKKCPEKNWVARLSCM